MFTKRTACFAAEADARDSDAPVEHAGASSSQPKQRGSTLSSETKAALCQAVAIGNIAPANMARALNLAGTCGDVKKIEDPVPEDVARFAKLQQDGCSDRSVLVYFSTGKQAFEAVPVLHRSAPGASTKAEQQLWCRQVNGEGAHVRRHRACCVHTEVFVHSAAMPHELCLDGHSGRPVQALRRMLLEEAGLYSCQTYALRWLALDATCRNVRVSAGTS